MYRVFTKEQKPKEIFNVNMTKKDIEEYNIDIWVDHKDLNQEDCVVVYRKEPFLAPIYDGGEIRETTKEEKIELGYDYELETGEKVENGKLVKVPQPSNLHRPIWDKESGTWKEGATSREVLLARKDALLKAKAIKKEIRDLEEIESWGDDLGEDFDEEDLGSDDTIAMLRAEFDDLMRKVSKLTKLYKKLKKQGM